MAEDTELDDTPAQLDDTPAQGEDGRWVLQNLGDTKRVGRVVAESPGSIQIEFVGGDRVIWDALPKSARFVDPTSLAYRAAVEPQAIRDQLRSDPASLAVAILREIRQPADAPELRQRLAGLGLIPPATRPSAGAKAPDPWPELWRKVRPALLAHEHVRVDGKLLAWSDTAIAKAGPVSRPRQVRVRDAAPVPTLDPAAPLALLERLATAGVDAEERQALRQEARDTLRAPADPYLAAAVVALGVSASTAVDWTRTPPPHEAAPAVASEVLRLARRQEAWRYLVATGTTPDDSVSDKAHVLLDGVSPGPLGVAAAEEVDSWSASVRRGGPTAIMARRVELLGGLLPPPLSIAATAALLRLLVVLAPRAADAAGRPAVRATLALLDTGADDATDRALAAAQLSEADTAQLLAAMAGHRAGRGTARARLLEAIAVARPELAGAPGALAGIDPADLVHLASLPTLGPLLTGGTPLCEAVTVPLLSQLVGALDLDGLLAARHWPAGLVALVPTERYTEALRAAAHREDARLLAAALDGAAPA